MKRRHNTFGPVRTDPPTPPRASVGAPPFPTLPAGYTSRDFLEQLGGAVTSPPTVPADPNLAGGFGLGPVAVGQVVPPTSAWGRHEGFRTLEELAASLRPAPTVASLGQVLAGPTVAQLSAAWPTSPPAQTGFLNPLVAEAFGLKEPFGPFPFYPIPQPEPFALGTHLYSPRTGYFHHGICVGSNTVIGRAGDHRKDMASARIRAVSLEEFADGHAIGIVRYAEPTFAPEEIVRRAWSKLHDPGYDLLRKNCEHFARWCTVGREESKQVQGGIAAIAAGGLLYLLLAI